MYFVIIASLLAATGIILSIKSTTQGENFEKAYSLGMYGNISFTIAITLLFIHTIMRNLPI